KPRRSLVSKAKEERPGSSKLCCCDTNQSEEAGPMSSLTPSEQVTKIVNDLLDSQRKEGEHLLSDLMKLGLQKLVQEVLEAEVTEVLGRGRYERHAAADAGTACPPGSAPSSIPAASNTTRDTRAATRR